MPSSTLHPKTDRAAGGGRGSGGEALGAALRPAWVDVDLDALERNFRALAARLRPARVLAILKADAYGHGAPRAARLLEEAGVDQAGVALLEEGAELRRAGCHLPILVLGTAQPSQLPLFRRYRLTATVSSLDQLELWRAWTTSEGLRRQPVHLKVDTGMTRLGIAAGDLPAALAAVRATAGLELTGLSSHFAEADDPESAANPRQEARFADLLALLTADERGRITVHHANSAAALHRAPSRHDLVRLGLALYGYDPVRPLSGRVDPGPVGAGEAASPLEPPLEPVMAVRARIVQQRTVPPGTAVGYGGRWRAERPSEIAVVPIGYADGYAWRLGGVGVSALAAGRRVPVVGSISMDMVTLDVTGTGARLGDEVVLLGRQGAERIDAWELADAAGTIPYELLCLLGLRLPRRYFRHGRWESAASRFSEGGGG